MVWTARAWFPHNFTHLNVNQINIYAALTRDRSTHEATCRSAPAQNEKVEKTPGNRTQ